MATPTVPQAEANADPRKTPDTAEYREATSGNDDDIGNLKTPALEQTRATLYVYRGTIWLLMSEFVASVMALTTRYLVSLPEGKRLHPLTLISWRMWIAFIGILVFGWSKGTPDFPLGRKRLRWLLCVRGIGGFFGASGFYFALTVLPLPDATVIQFLVPTLVGIGCSLVPRLREPFTRLERLSAFVSFIGVILIARPSFMFPGKDTDDETSVIHKSARMFAVLAALTGVCGNSIALVCIRTVGKRVDPLVQVAYFTGFSAILSTVCLVAIPSLPSPALPSGRLEWESALALGIGGFVMQYALTVGMQIEKGSRGSQIRYVQLVFALFWELVVWGYLPNGISLVGMAIIIGSVAMVNIYKEADVVVAPTDEERPLLQES